VNYTVPTIVDRHIIILKPIFIIIKINILLLFSVNDNQGVEKWNSCNRTSSLISNDPPGKLLERIVHGLECKVDGSRSRGRGFEPRHRNVHIKKKKYLKFFFK
jgi:hypothetical protein